MFTEGMPNLSKGYLEEADSSDATELSLFKGYLETAEVFAYHLVSMSTP